MAWSLKVELLCARRENWVFTAEKPSLGLLPISIKRSCRELNCYDHLPESWADWMRSHLVANLAPVSLAGTTVKRARFITQMK